MARRTQTITHKRGDTFRKVLDVSLTDAAPGETLGAVAVRSMIRDQETDALIDELDVSVTQVDGVSLLLAISKPYASTALWPVGTLAWDVEFTLGSERISTDTMLVNLIEDETYGPP